MDVFMDGLRKSAGYDNKEANKELISKLATMYLDYIYLFAVGGKQECKELKVLYKFCGVHKYHQML